ncbi:MAG TPA: BON domain-containing protein [Gammaproteobacteria bacterium]|nr:BON domain-containing protein [Gammaproteobacteria bacterium]
MKTHWIQNLKANWIVFVAIIAFPLLAAASNNVTAAINDTVITGKIKSSLATNEVTRALQISVETNNGIVSLSGTAKSETEATKAIEIAESTVGVRSVDTSRLYVQNSGQPLTDAYITAKVKGMFIKHNLITEKQTVPLLGVTVETQNGVVYLSGAVTNRAQRETLINLAKSVDGVADVKSTVKIK